mgnify:CR=1 FL=1
MSIFAFFHSTHDLHQLKKHSSASGVIPAMYAKFVGTLIIMSFHASVWLHAARALLRSYALASGHVGPKSFPGAAPRRLRFGHSSTNNRNGGQYGYYQFAGLLPILYIGLLHGSIGRSCRNVQRV